MEIRELSKLAKDLKEVYDNLNRIRVKKIWQAPDYAQGLVGDASDLMRLVAQRNKDLSMAQRKELDKKIRHEMADCMWSLVSLADELNIDLEKEYLITIDYLRQKLSESIAEL